MAAKRMLNCNLIKSDQFTSLSYAAQSLYLQINLSADDDGFCNEVKSIMKVLQVKKNILIELLQKGYLIQFKNGVVVINHWNVHNTLKNDRYNGTLFTYEKDLLLLDKSKTYRLNPRHSHVDYAINTSNLEPQYSIEESSKDLDNLSKGEVNEANDENQGIGTYKNVKLTTEEHYDLFNERDMINNFSNYLHNQNIRVDNHYEALKTWFKDDYYKAKDQERNNN